MNARILRRLFLPLAMAAVVGASAYAATGISSAATSPHLSRPAAVKTIRVTFTVRNKEGKIIRRETGVATVVRIAVGSAAATVAGAASPQSGVGGPSEVCVAHTDYSASVGSLGYIGIKYTFPSAPFVAGSSFNESSQPVSAIESVETPGGRGDVVVVWVENGWTKTQTIAGYFNVIYWDGGC
jgi:hypothetical protein